MALLAILPQLSCGIVIIIDCGKAKSQSQGLTDRRNCHGQELKASKLGMFCLLLLLEISAYDHLQSPILNEMFAAEDLKEKEL